MKRTQRNKLASHTAVAVVLGDHATDVAAIPGLPAKVAALQAALGEIHRLAITQIQPTEPSTMESGRLLTEMVDSALGIAGVVTALARERAQPELARSVRVSRGTFRQLPNQQRIWLAQRVHDIAMTVAPDLGAFGVTDETLAESQARIDAAATGIGLPRDTVVSRRVATVDLGVLLREVGSLLSDQIDRLVFLHRKTKPALYAAYRAARVVVDRSGGGVRPPVTTAASAAVTSPVAMASPAPAIPIRSEQQAA